MTDPTGTTLDQQLADAIEQAATVLAIKAPDIGSGLGKSYEAWLMLEIAAGVPAPYSAVPIDYKGDPTTVLVVRGGPGYIASASGHSANQAGAIRIDQGGYPAVELHASLRHRGLSNASHEIDISLNLASVCQAVRRSGTAPYPGPPILGLELKQYGADQNLNKNFGRALLAVAVDLQPQWLFNEILLGRAGRVLGAWHARNGRARYRMVTTAGLTAETSCLLNTYGIAETPHFEPGNHGPLSEIVTEAMECIRASWSWAAP